MSALRTLFLALLLLALLPWGAHLRAMPVPAGAFAAGQGQHLAPVTAEKAQQPAVKCRKGLPGSPCTPEAKALLSLAGHDRPGTLPFLPVQLRGPLPDGMADRPAVPPPRLV